MSSADSWTVPRPAAMSSSASKKRKILVGNAEENLLNHGTYPLG